MQPDRVEWAEIYTIHDIKMNGMLTGSQQGVLRGAGVVAVWHRAS